MKILSGNLKGKNLAGSKDLSIRPTTNRIKESIFNSVQGLISGKKIADFFSGSGNLGIESISRNAAHVTFIEKEYSSIAVLKSNLLATSIDESLYHIVHADAVEFASYCADVFDVIFMDPPFKYPPLNQLLSVIFLQKLLQPNGILIVEHEIDNPIEKSNTMFEIVKQKKIGRGLISYIMWPGKDND